jgi:HD superfamily phosphodiesterase
MAFNLAERDNANLMAGQIGDFQSLVESRFQGLMDEIHQIIQQSENKHDGVSSSESFLWEHTIHAASIAHKLSVAEGLDPLIPTIAALFHDAGKFSGGQYHADEIAEEEESAAIAQKLLDRHGMKAGDIRKIVSGLKALYHEKARKNAIAAIIHDADFLSKFGALGVAGFFIKSTLRRRTLRSTVLGYLSKELTYASCLPLNMHTSAGKKMAAKKSADSLKFFRALLLELRETRIADLRIRQIRIADPESANRIWKVQLVFSPACPKCSGDWGVSWATEKGIKCRKLNVDCNCSRCGERLETSFCLPEVAGL